MPTKFSKKAPLTSGFSAQSKKYLLKLKTAVLSKNKIIINSKIGFDIFFRNLG